MLGLDPWDGMLPNTTNTSPSHSPAAPAIAPTPTPALSHSLTAPAVAPQPPAIAPTPAPAIAPQPHGSPAEAPHLNAVFTLKALPAVVRHLVADQVGFPVEGLGALVAFVLPLLGVDHHVLLQAWEERHGRVCGACRAQPAPRGAPDGAVTHSDKGDTAPGSRWGH